MTKEVKEVKGNAVQRLLVLEEKYESVIQVLQSFNQKIQMLAGEIDRDRAVIAAVAKRVNAVIESGEKGAVSGDSVTKILIENEVKELEDKVQFLISNKALEHVEGIEISDSSFIVGREVDKDGNVINSRFQFAMNAVQDEGQRTLFLGHKEGDVIEDGDARLEITKVYSIVTEDKTVEFKEEVTPAEVVAE